MRQSFVLQNKIKYKPTVAIYDHVKMYLEMNIVVYEVGLGIM